ncbi:MAG: multicopper oxidase domain-containing protein, partial [Actinomycetes bacterium]
MSNRQNALVRPVSRRAFIKAAGVAGAGFVLYTYLPGGTKVALAQIPGGTLDPNSVPKYTTPLLIPPAMPRAGTMTLPGGKPADTYEISMRQFQEQILPAGFPATTVWGYGAIKSANKRGILLHHAPSLTIEAKWNRPVRIKWINELVDANGNYLPHLLPVDQTLHWANPPGGVAGRDDRPTFTETPGPYTGPVPIVTHVHGSVSVGDDSDGYAEAWYLPAANNIPAGYATEGTWYNFFAAKAAAKYGVQWGPGLATFQYPNTQRESTIWYHDHSLGMTRLNVYAGPAGFFLIRGGPEGEKAITDSRTGTTAVLPSPAPKEGDAFPSNKTYYEIPIAIQDRSFNQDGSLFYPDSREFFDGATAADPGFIPFTDLSPIWNPEFFGNMIMVNGNTWPFQQVEKRRYRLRFLNGCQSRFLILDFNQIPGVEVWQIGNEGGFLPAPVNLTVGNGNRLLMALAERADLIVDFTNVPVGQHILTNVGPDEPFGGGEPPDDFDSADPDTTGQIMAFNVVPAVAPDPTTPPAFMVLPARVPLPAETVTRPLALVELGSEFWDGPAEARLGYLDAGGNAVSLEWADAVTENPASGVTEVWEMHNVTADAHPMHIHEVAFEVVNREGLVLDPETGEPV